MQTGAESDFDVEARSVYGVEYRGHIAVSRRSQAEADCIFPPAIMLHAFCRYEAVGESASFDT